MIKDKDNRGAALIILFGAAIVALAIYMNADKLLENLKNLFPFA